MHITAVVVSNKSGVKGIERAENLDVPTVVIEASLDLEGDERRISHELEIEQTLLDYEVELVILSGYMRLLSHNLLPAGKVKYSTSIPLVTRFPRCTRTQRRDCIRSR